MGEVIAAARGGEQAKRVPSILPQDRDESERDESDHQTEVAVEDKLHGSVLSESMLAPKIGCRADGEM